jgi:hypothetical protein
MSRFRSQELALALVAVIVASALALWVPSILQFAAGEGTTTFGKFYGICVLGTFALVGVSVGVQRQLPNYGGSPPFRDFVCLAALPTMTGGMAIALGWGATVLLTTMPDGFLQFVRVLDAAVLLWCLRLVGSAFFDYQRAGSAGRTTSYR